MKTWIKAGLLGSILEIIFTLPTILIFIVPEMIGNIISCCTSIAYIFVLPFVGIIAVVWLQKPITNRSVVIQSALAGLLASVIDGVFTIALVAILSTSGWLNSYIEQTMPYLLTNDNTNVILNYFLSLPGQLIFTSVCCIVNIIIATGLSVIGALIYASIIKNKNAGNK